MKKIVFSKKKEVVIAAEKRRFDSIANPVILAVPEGGAPVEYYDKDKGGWCKLKTKFTYQLSSHESP